MSCSIFPLCARCVKLSENKLKSKEKCFEKLSMYLISIHVLLMPRLFRPRAYIQIYSNTRKEENEFSEIVSISWGTNSSRRIGRYNFLKFVVPSWWQGTVYKGSLHSMEMRGGVVEKGEGWRRKSQRGSGSNFSFLHFFTCSQSPTLDWHVWTSFLFSNFKT